MPAPGIKVTPDPLSFDTTAASLNIKNTGGADLVVHSIAFTSETMANAFHLSASAPFTIHAGGAHMVAVTCSAPDGICRGVVDIKSNAGEVLVPVLHRGNISQQTGGGHHRGSSPPGSGCFTPSTLVLMADGAPRAIQSLNVGEAILTIAENGGAPAPAIVEAVLRHDDPHAVFAVDGIHVTAPHRWAVTRDGRRAFVRTTALSDSDRLLTCGAGEARAAAVVALAAPAPSVFNLETSARTFAVGARRDGPFYVVHNAKDRQTPLNDNFRDRDEP